MLGGGRRLTAQHQDFSFVHIFDNPLEVLQPMIVGAVPTAIVVWFVFYWPLQRMIAQSQGTKRYRRRKQLHREVVAEHRTADTAQAEDRLRQSVDRPRKGQDR